MRRITFYLSLLMIFAVPWQETVYLPGLGTAGRMVGLLAAASWVFTVIVTYKIRRLTALHLVFFLFFFWNAASIFWSLNIEATYARMFVYIRMAGMVLLIWDVYDSPQDIRAGLQTYLLGAYVQIGSIFYNFLLGQESVYGRFSAAGNNANNSGLMISLAMPIAWYLAATYLPSRRTQFLRIVNYLFIPLGLIAIFLTASRFAAIVSGLACIYGLGTLGQVKLFPRIVFLILISYVAFVLSSIVPQSSYQRLAEADDSIRAGDLTGRVAIWGNALDLWSQHPMLGIGTGVFKTISESGRSTHNSYIAAGVETGVMGFVLFVSIILNVIITAVRFPRRDASFWMAFLIVWGLSSMVLYMTHVSITWLFISLIMTHSRIVNDNMPVEARSSPLSEPEPRMAFNYATTN